MQTQGNSFQIKVTIDFCWNFLHWIFIIRELQFWNNMGVFMLIKSLWARLMRKCIKLVSGTNKYFKFDLDRKLNPWLNFEPCFFIWLSNGKIEKAAVYLPFFLFIQFSATEIRLVSLTQSVLQWLEKKWGAHARWWATANFQLTELNIKANPPCF